MYLVFLRNVSMEENWSTPVGPFGDYADALAFVRKVDNKVNDIGGAYPWRVRTIEKAVTEDEVLVHWEA